MTPASVWPEYPRPQLMRSVWQVLNGTWKYAIAAASANDTAPARFDGTLLVPYPVGSRLSGVSRKLQAGERLWYRRSFTLAPDLAGDVVLLHFEAIDSRATILLNDRAIGKAPGDAQRLTLDITHSLKPGANELTVGIVASQAAARGIWQTVWIEAVPANYVQNLTFTPDADHGSVTVEALIAGDTSGLSGYAVISGRTSGAGAEPAAEGVVRGRTTLRIKQPHRWSPEDPYLYEVDLAVMRDAQIVDQVHSYFGLRKVEAGRDAQGRTVIVLNGQPLFNLGAAASGVWPDGDATAPSDAALRFDIEAAKAMNFNTLLVRGTPASDRWYFYCDRLGMLVWQEIPGIQEIAQRAGHPSIVAWLAPGANAASPARAALVRDAARADTTRLAGTFPGNAGGASLIDPAASSSSNASASNASAGAPPSTGSNRTPEQYAAQAATLRASAANGVAGAIAAQLTDSDSAPGLLSADRSRAHVALAQIAIANRTVVPQAGHYYPSLRELKAPPKPQP